MKKRFGTVELNTETMQMYNIKNGVEIICPRDIYKMYQYMCTFEFLQENYENDEEELWTIAVETREMQDKYYDQTISETEAIGMACDKEGITLIEREKITMKNNKTYHIHIMNASTDDIVAKLETNRRSIAMSMIYDYVSDTWTCGDTHKIGLYDPDFGYYVVAIPHPNQHIYKEFEIIAVSETEPLYKDPSGTREYLFEALDK